MIRAVELRLIRRGSVDSIQFTAVTTAHQTGNASLEHVTLDSMNFCAAMNTTGLRDTVDLEFRAWGLGLRV